MIVHVGLIAGSLSLHMHIASKQFSYISVQMSKISQKKIHNYNYALVDLTDILQTYNQYCYNIWSSCRLYRDEIYHFVSSFLPGTSWIDRASGSAGIKGTSRRTRATRKGRSPRKHRREGTCRRPWWSWSTWKSRKFDHLCH